VLSLIYFSFIFNNYETDDKLVGTLSIY